ncbi:hypothetical protein QBC32DRAFT_371971 [Pseudoneurospora amorphoporcata]|uniref:Uncharacterized protein n=1 Tax=Pseudoneurospora amorphoporcata TaxID=241081 RepID=A0AAN6NQX8_9PEZI|nr:hypothetical protein QBC32DRAFT_371971 [Pseudoneurospora amorphoporcata]
MERGRGRGGRATKKMRGTLSSTSHHQHHSQQFSQHSPQQQHQQRPVAQQHEFEHQFQITPFPQANGFNNTNTTTGTVNPSIPGSSSHAPHPSSTTYTPFSDLTTQDPPLSFTAHSENNQPHPPMHAYPQMHGHQIQGHPFEQQQQQYQQQAHHSPSHQRASSTNSFRGGRSRQAIYPNHQQRRTASPSAPDSTSSFRVTPHSDRTAQTTPFTFEAPSSIAMPAGTSSARKRSRTFDSSHEAILEGTQGESEAEEVKDHDHTALRNKRSNNSPAPARNSSSHRKPASKKPATAQSTYAKHQSDNDVQDTILVGVSMDEIPEVEEELGQSATKGASADSQPSKPNRTGAVSQGEQPLPRAVDEAGQAPKDGNIESTSNGDETTPNPSTRENGNTVPSNKTSTNEPGSHQIAAASDETEKSRPSDHPPSRQNLLRNGHFKEEPTEQDEATNLHSVPELIAQAHPSPPISSSKVNSQPSNRPPSPPITTQGDDSVATASPASSSQIVRPPKPGFPPRMKDLEKVYSLETPTAASLKLTPYLDDDVTHPGPFTERLVLDPMTKANPTPIPTPATSPGPTPAQTVPVAPVAVSEPTSTELNWDGRRKLNREEFYKLWRQEIAKMVASGQPRMSMMEFKNNYYIPRLLEARAESGGEVSETLPPTEPAPLPKVKQASRPADDMPPTEPPTAAPSPSEMVDDDDLATGSVADDEDGQYINGPVFDSDTAAGSIEPLEVVRQPRKQWSFPKIRDVQDFADALEDFQDMDDATLYKLAEAMSETLNVWQTEFRELRKVVDDEDNAERRKKNDVSIVNWENRLKAEDAPHFRRHYDEPTKGPPAFELKGVRAPKPSSDDPIYEHQKDQDKIMAAAYGFKHNPHANAVGRQNIEEQRWDITETRPHRKGAGKAELAEENVVEGKRVRKPRNLSDQSKDPSRAGTPTGGPSTVVGRRGKRKQLASNDDSVEASDQTPATEVAPEPVVRKRRGPKPKKLILAEQAQKAKEEQEAKEAQEALEAEQAAAAEQADSAEPAIEPQQDVEPQIAEDVQESQELPPGDEAASVAPEERKPEETSLSAEKPKSGRKRGRVPAAPPSVEETLVPTPSPTETEEAKTKRQRQPKVALPPLQEIAPQSFYNNSAPLDNGAPELPPPQEQQVQRPSTASSEGTNNTAGTPESSYSLRDKRKRNFALENDPELEPRQQKRARNAISAKPEGHEPKKRGPKKKNANVTSQPTSAPPPPPPALAPQQPVGGLKAPALFFNNGPPPIAPAPGPSPFMHTFNAAPAFPPGGPPPQVPAPPAITKPLTRIKIKNPGPPPMGHSFAQIPPPQAAPPVNTGPHPTLKGPGKAPRAPKAATPIPPEPVEPPKMMPSGFALANTTEPDKPYAEMSKSEKMSYSMRRRWASGEMQGAVEKRRTTLANKKAEKAATGGPNGNEPGMMSMSQTPDPVSAGPSTGASAPTTPSMGPTHTGLLALPPQPQNVQNVPIPPGHHQVMHSFPQLPPHIMPPQHMSPKGMLQQSMAPQQMPPQPMAPHSMAPQQPMPPMVQMAQMAPMPPMQQMPPFQHQHQHQLQHQHQHQHMPPQPMQTLSYPYPPHHPSGHGPVA